MEESETEEWKHYAGKGSGASPIHSSYLIHSQNEDSNEDPTRVFLGA